MEPQLRSAGASDRAAPGDPIDTDALIVGAGPVGLFQVFELGLLDVKAHVIDALPHPGGQPAELYPDKPIYDIPGLPYSTGQSLTDALLQQIAPFNARFHLGQQVSAVQQREDRRFQVSTTQGTQFLTKTLFIAAGAGAFLPRTLKVPGLQAFEGSQVFYRVDHPADLAGKNLVIVGDADDAIDCALAFAAEGPHPARSVTLVHRRDAFKAAPASVARMRERCAQGRMRFMVGQITGIETQNSRLASVQITGADGATQRVPLEVLLVFQGLSPKLGPIADWGLQMQRKQLVVDTERFSTSVPGIFAVGDINTYPGKRKLLLCGFHECTLAAYGAAAIVFPGKPVLLQYTTTSPQLHKALGVATPSQD